MHLTPHEQERLLVHVAADVAQRRRDRGLLLNYPEVMALLTAHVYEEARAGVTVDSVMESGRRVLKRSEVMDGVPEMIANVQVEATFPDGTKLVTIHDPFDEPAEDVDVHPGKLELRPDDEEIRGGVQRGPTASRGTAREQPVGPPDPGRLALSLRRGQRRSPQGQRGSASTGRRHTACGCTFPPARRSDSSPVTSAACSSCLSRGERKVRGLQAGKAENGGNSMR